MNEENLFDVVAVNMDKSTVRLIDRNKTRANAEAIEKMAVMRRGVEVEFFAVVPADDYKDGDKWRWS